jgi:ribosomal protein L24
MVPINRLLTERVNPRLEEVQTFQSASKTNGGSAGAAAASMDDFLSDEDEWDILDDETLKKTIDDVDGFSFNKQFEIGDNVEATSGQYKGIKGHIVKLLDSNLGKIHFLTFLFLVLMKSSDKLKMEIKVWTKDLKKYFETGENVVVISGLHAGGSGMITAIQDKHAIVAMEGTNHELKILLSNIKIKRDDLGYVKLEDVLKKSEVQALY